MTWKCGAIDHGITFYPNGKIGPCCQISAEYLKDISEVNNPNRFADLKQESPPTACETCVVAEYNNLPSYRNNFNNADPDKGLQYVDVRSSNRCNLKCRYCGPHFSNLWGQELEVENELLEVDLEPYYDQIITQDVTQLYFTGGEPFLLKSHWDMLQLLVDKGLAHNISLMYNSNLTTLKYKNVDIKNLWNKFKSVNVHASIDATGKLFEYIRSGARWDRVYENLKTISSYQNVNVDIACTVSILNIWELDKFDDFCYNNNYDVEYFVLSGPDYLALDVVPDVLKDLALKVLDNIERKSPQLEQMRKLIKNNQNQCLIDHTIRHVLLIDNIRNEELFQLLPFMSTAKKRTLNNDEYK